MIEDYRDLKKEKPGCEELYQALVGLYGTVCGLKRWRTSWPNVLRRAKDAIEKHEMTLDSPTERQRARKEKP